MVFTLLISPSSFALRVDEWHQRTKGTDFLLLDYAEAMDKAEAGDLVYCDPPYQETQSIFIGQAFRLERLFEVIARCKARGVRVALSLDGTKKIRESFMRYFDPPGTFRAARFISIAVAPCFGASRWKGERWKEKS